MSGRRLYDWWSDHTLAQRLLYGVAFFGREATLRDRGVDALALSPGEYVLEVGCGPGTNFGRLREAVGPEGRVVGVDYSAGMVAAAADRIDRQGWANVDVVRGDAATLPLADEAVDAAYAAMSLSAMPALSDVLADTRRVLRPDGRLAVLDARLFPSLPLSLLNPLLTALFSATTNWQPELDVPAALREAFPSVAVDSYGGGSLFVATAGAHSAVATTET